MLDRSSRIHRACVAVLLVVVWLGTDARIRASELHIAPAEVMLGAANPDQQIVVTSKATNGAMLDVTRRCEFRLTRPGVARMVGSRLTALSEGQAELVVRFEGAEARVAVRVRDFDRHPPIHFVNDIVPLFSKLGCNSSGCHGKASGQNGFKLSVFGFDPVADHDALVNEARGRRVFPSSPENSLLLLKATGRVAHGGGRRLDPTSKDYRLFLEWIRQGTPRGSSDAPRLVGIRVYPESRVVGFGTEQQLLTTAVYSDGSSRDVTDAASYSSNATTVADMAVPGLVGIGKRPGEAAITVHYSEKVGVVRLVVPRPDRPAKWPALESKNPIDRLVWARSKLLGILPSESADDAMFLRRVYLDTIGTLPTPEEVRAFLGDDKPDKRKRCIDSLLGRPEFADFWAQKWADILMVDRKKLGERGAYRMHRWLRKQMAENRPYDEWVRGIVTASGSSGTYGPVNFYRAFRTPEEAVRGVSQAFLGVRVECAQCHHHPFEKWGQSDFYGMTGYFNGLQRKKLGDGREMIYHSGSKPVRIPISEVEVTTRPLGDEPLPGIGEGDPRRALADWMTSPKNRWFAKLVANRLWKHFLGRGLVEAEDDLRSTNPPTNEPLLDYLAELVVTKKYDLKTVMREILNSRVYQLSSVPNANNVSDNQNYSRYYVRRLPAAVLFDAICSVTGVPESFPGLPRGTRAIQLWDNRMPSYFLDVFGRSERRSPCECGRSDEPTLPQVLHLMNAPEIERKIGHPSGRVAKLLAAGAGRSKIVEELCLAALGRLPNSRERRVARSLFEQAATKQAAEDFLWTLLNSKDFLFVR